ncbi:TIGR02391 family protein [Paraburkholderia fungorum]|nr:TIGR02391 family protein [Paraburkholderia fungorum]
MSPLHPFELRNVHPGMPAKVRKLFDDGHGAEATFHAFKFVEKVVQKHSGSREIGRKLMMNVFGKATPMIKLNGLANPSEEDEQEGYQFMFAGSVAAIRNPGGHEITLSDDPDVCLDHLAFASLLLRRLERAGYK